MKSLPPDLKPAADFALALARLARNDRYSAFNQRDGKSYHLVSTPITAEVIERHISGDQPIAVFPVIGDVTQIAVLDIDNHNGGSWEAVVDATQPIIYRLIADGFKPFAVRSGGGQGIHIWLVW